MILAEIVVDNWGIEAATYNGFPTTSAGDLLTIKITDVSYDASANNAVWTFTY